MANTYTAEMKQPNEIVDCKEGARIILVYPNREYHGIFRGMDGDDTIMLRSEGEKPMTLGFPLCPLKFWLLKDEAKTKEL